MLCFVQFNCTDKCPKYAQYTYTKEMKNGEKITLCVAEDYNAIGCVVTQILHITNQVIHLINAKKWQKGKQNWAE